LTTSSDFERKDIFDFWGIDMQWPESLPELAARNYHLIVHQHLCKIVEPAGIERVFLRDSLNALA
jgi:hypothetical protein